MSSVYRFRGEQLEVRCSICHTWKPGDQMATEKGKPHGVDTRCKECKKPYSANIDQQSQPWKSLREWLLRYTSIFVYVRDNVRHIAVKNSSNNYNEFLGCTPKQAWDHILSQREPWMTLENYGDKNDNTWNIDHIVPFHLAKSCKEVLRIAHYSNLRPQRSNDNRLREDIPEEEIQRLLGRGSNEEPIDRYKDPEDLREIINIFSNADKFILTNNTQFTTDKDYYSDRVTAALYKAGWNKASYLQKLPEGRRERKSFNAGIKTRVIEILSNGKRIPINNQLKLF